MARIETKDRLEALFKRYGDPLEIMAEIASDPTKDDSVRLNAAKELAGYAHAKVKALEISGPDGAELSMRVELKGKIMDMLEKLQK
jgi:hypothetical protein